MNEFWQVALGVAGMGAIGAFVFWSLYKDWLKLKIFQQMTKEQQYKLFVLFLTFTFVLALASLVAFVVVSLIDTPDEIENNDITGTLYLDDQLVSSARIYLRDLDRFDNDYIIKPERAGQFAFRNIIDIGKTVNFTIDVEGPVDYREKLYTLDDYTRGDKVIVKLLSANLRLVSNKPVFTSIAKEPKMTAIEGSKCVVTLHIRVLSEPNAAAIGIMVRAMRDVYEPNGIKIHVKSVEKVSDVPEHLQSVYVGACEPGQLTNDQRELFNMRKKYGDVSENEIVVYFVRSMIGSRKGFGSYPVFECPSHPANQPGMIVAGIAKKWTLAHGVGHVLGLTHKEESGRLMYKFQGGPRKIKTKLPTLSAAEILQILKSPYVRTETGE